MGERSSRISYVRASHCTSNIVNARLSQSVLAHPHQISQQLYNLSTFLRSPSQIHKILPYLLPPYLSQDIHHIHCCLSSSSRHLSSLSLSPLLLLLVLLLLTHSCRAGLFFFLLILFDLLFMLLRQFGRGSMFRGCQSGWPGDFFSGNRAGRGGK